MDIGTKKQQNLRFSEKEVAMIRKVEQFRKRHEKLSASGRIKQIKGLFAKLISYHKKFDRVFSEMQKLVEEVDELERKLKAVGVGELLGKLKSKRV